MEATTNIIISIYALGFIIVVLLLVYLLMRRINIKEREDFEERDN